MAGRPYVFICRGIPAHERAILDEFCVTKMYDGLSGMRIPRSDFLRGVKGADGIFVIAPDQIDTELLDAAGLGPFIQPGSLAIETTHDRPFVYISGGIPASGRTVLEEYCETKMYDGSFGVQLPRTEFLRAVKGTVGLFVTSSNEKIDSELLDAAASGRAILDEHCETIMYDGSLGRHLPRIELLRAVKGARGLCVSSADKIDYELLNVAGPQLKVVGTMSVGLEHIDLEECARRGVKVGYTPDVLTDAVAEEAIGLTLATSRRFKEGMAEMTNGGWHTTWDDSLYLCGADVKASTVGIVGLGRIGLAVAKRLLPFGIKQLLYSGHSPKDHAREVGAEFVSFDELLSKSDFIICCCSMNPENIGLFNKDAFAKMKKNAILINVSRGALVNQDDLYDALKSGQILAAGLDCTKPEPLPLDSPLLTLNNCTILPHLGSASTSVRHVMIRLTVQNILAGLKGEPLPTPAPV